MRLYSKEFDTVANDSLDNLYVNDYGDEEEPYEVPSAAPPTAPDSPPFPQDDNDYPIEVLTANMLFAIPARESVLSPNEAGDARGASFTASKVEMLRKLTDRYPNLPVRRPGCGEALRGMYECYGSAVTLTDCRKSVNEYSQCTRRQLNNVLGIESI